MYRFTTISIAIGVMSMVCATAASAFEKKSSKSATPEELVQKFSAICLANLPDLGTEGTKEAALANQINFKDEYGRLGGFSEDFAYGVQLKPGKECVVTSVDIDDVEAVTNAFKAALESKFNSLKTKSSKGSIVYRSNAKMDKRKFILAHDTDGGEALVILRR